MKSPVPFKQYFNIDRRESLRMAPVSHFIGFWAVIFSHPFLFRVNLRLSASCLHIFAGSDFWFHCRDGATPNKSNRKIFLSIVEFFTSVSNSYANRKRELLSKGTMRRLPSDLPVHQKDLFQKVKHPLWKGLPRTELWGHQAQITTGVNARCPPRSLLWNSNDVFYHAQSNLW